MFSHCHGETNSSAHDKDHQLTRAILIRLRQSHQDTKDYYSEGEIDAATVRTHVTYMKKEHIQN